jgi:hypothetical protein
MDFEKSPLTPSDSDLRPQYTPRIHLVHRYYSLIALLTQNGVHSSKSVRDLSFKK